MYDIIYQYQILVSFWILQLLGMINQLYTRYTRVYGRVVRASIYDIIYHYQIIVSFWILQLLGMINQLYKRHTRV